MFKAPKRNLLITLFLLGLPGIFTLLLLPLPLPPGVEVPIPLAVLRWLVLVQPTLLLAIAVAVGTHLFDKVGLSAPVIQSLLSSTPTNHKGDGIRPILTSQFVAGLVGGVVSVAVFAVLQSVAQPYLPAAYVALNQSGSAAQAPALVRLLYGGITEELLLRWGMMTFLVWLFWKLFQRRSSLPRPSAFWFGSLVAALLFGIGHLPVLFSLIAQPTPFLLLYIVLLNMVFGVIAGWLYWRRGLESAIFAHITVHLVSLAIASLGLS